MAKEPRPQPPKTSESGVPANLKLMALVVAGMLLVTGVVFGAPLVKLACALVLTFGAKFVFDAARGD